MGTQVTLGRTSVRPASQQPVEEGETASRGSYTSGVGERKQVQAPRELGAEAQPRAAHDQSADGLWGGRFRTAAFPLNADALCSARGDTAAPRRAHSVVIAERRKGSTHRVAQESRGRGTWQSGSGF